MDAQSAVGGWRRLSTGTGCPEDDLGVGRRPGMPLSQREGRVGVGAYVEIKLTAQKSLQSREAATELSAAKEETAEGCVAMGHAMGHAGRRQSPRGRWGRCRRLGEERGLGSRAAGSVAEGSRAGAAAPGGRRKWGE